MEQLELTVDHIRGSATGRLILEYGDCECPYWRQAYGEIERVESRLGDEVRFAYRHFPLSEIHPHALAAASSAEAAALQDRFWEISEQYRADRAPGSGGRVRRLPGDPGELVLRRQRRLRGHRTVMPADLQFTRREA